MQKSEVGHLPYTYTKINSKWVKNLNNRAKPIKVVKENVQGNFMTLDVAMVSWTRHPKHRQQWIDQ